MINPFDDTYFMREALKEAKKAFDLDEVPVGCVITCDNQIIARSHNYMEALNDSTAHAEMQAFTMASDYLGGKYLNNCALYVTLEPCVMCAGAAFWTQIDKIVFGAFDKKNGFMSVNPNIIHRKKIVKSGLLEHECSKLLLDFFGNKR